MAIIRNIRGINSRITHPTPNGTYIFNVSCPKENEYWAELIFYQQYPQCEATEQTLVKRQKASSYEEARQWMMSWYKEEQLRKFAGYNLKTKRLTYGEWLQQEEAKLWKNMEASIDDFS